MLTYIIVIYVCLFVCSIKCSSFLIRKYCSKFPLFMINWIFGYLFPLFMINWIFGYFKAAVVAVTWMLNSWKISILSGRYHEQWLLLYAPFKLKLNYKNGHFNQNVEGPYNNNFNLKRFLFLKVLVKFSYLGSLVYLPCCCLIILQVVQHLILRLKELFLLFLFECGFTRRVPQ